MPPKSKPQNPAKRAAPAEAAAKVSAPAKLAAAVAKAGKSNGHVFLIDGSSYIFRAYFAMFKAAQSRGRAFTRSDGLPVGAVMTFSNMLWKLLREGIDGVKPTHVASSDRLPPFDVYAEIVTVQLAPALPETMVFRNDDGLS